jgi:protein-tyrosine-phosphatase
MRVLFVCSGNTCRSPLAEALFRRMLDEAGRRDITVESAGTGAYDGAPASEGAFLVAIEAGLDLTRHRARLLDRELVAQADLILTMSRGHLSRVERLGGEGKAHLLGAYASASAEESELRDPYGGDVEGYRQTLRQLERLLFPARERLLAESAR